jgi:hypothetical protein
LNLHSLKLKTPKVIVVNGKKVKQKFLFSAFLQLEPTLPHVDYYRTDIHKEYLVYSKRQLKKFIAMDMQSLAKTFSGRPDCWTADPRLITVLEFNQCSDVNQILKLYTNIKEVIK